MNLVLPSKNHVTGKYAPNHRGIDYSGIGDPYVYAAADGVIEQSVNRYVSSWRNTGKLTTRDYGNYIKIKHDDGSYTLYAHLKKDSLLTVGTKVIQKQLIAQIGNTGNSTGKHLHFEYRNSNNINVEPVFEGDNMADEYKGLDLNNKESMRVAVDAWYDITHGDYEKIKKEEVEELRKTSERVATLEERIKQERKLKDQELEQQKNELSQQCDIRVQEARERVIQSKEAEIKSLKDQVGSLKNGNASNISEILMRYTSRKFVISVIAFIVFISTKFFNIEVTVAEMLAAVSPILVFIGAEGWTDHQERMATLK